MTLSIRVSIFKLLESASLARRVYLEEKKKGKLMFVDEVYLAP